jgi:hypothetical protein
LSLCSARSLTRWFRRSTTSESKVFCLLGGRVEGDKLKFDGVGFCSVSFFGVEGCDCALGGDGPPIKLLSARARVEEQDYFTYNSVPLYRFVEYKDEGSQGICAHTRPIFQGP